jgi:hypothetical protein
VTSPGARADRHESGRGADAGNQRLTDVTFDVIGDDSSECNKPGLRFKKATRAFVFVNAERAGDTLVASRRG